MCSGGGDTEYARANSFGTYLVERSFVRSGQMRELFESLTDRYRNLNRHEVSTDVTPRMT